MSLVQLNQREISFADGQLSYSIYECDSCESYFANWSSHQQSSCGKKTPGKKATFSLVLNEIERLYRAGQFSSFVQLRDVYHESPEAFVAGFSPAVQQQIDRDHKGFSPSVLSLPSSVPAATHCGRMQCTAARRVR